MEIGQKLKVVTKSGRGISYLFSNMNAMACFILLNNVLVDLTYGYLDPRIHYR